ncbi:fibronectin type III domain-containing protein, partial [Streptomyces sp. NPDC055607]
LTFSASPGATHYEIYMNGTKLLETKNTFMNVPNLSNGTAYTFYVVAVNTIGSAAPSNTVTVTPSASLPPNITLGYGLQDVSDGVSNWFGGIWLILAFSVSIPLAFFVANRLKGFFAT